MGILKYIHLPALIVSFLLGLAIMYFYIPLNRQIYVYPTPENEDYLQYKDLAGNCFSFERVDVSCPTDEKQIEKIPIQS